MAVCPTEAVFQEGIQGVPLEEPGITPQDMEQLISSRRSIRNYRAEDVRQEDLERLLSLLEYAPTGTNSQKSGVTVVQGREKVEVFSREMMVFFKKLVRMAFNPFTWPFLRIAMGSQKTAKLFNYKKMILQTDQDILCHQAPLVLIFHSSKKASTPDMDSNIHASYTTLHGESLGLGTCFNGFIAKGLNFNKGLKRKLGIPKDHKIYSSLLVGYPQLKYKRRGARRAFQVNFV